MLLVNATLMLNCSVVIHVLLNLMRTVRNDNLYAQFVYNTFID